MDDDSGVGFSTAAADFVTSCLPLLDDLDIDLKDLEALLGKECDAAFNVFDFDLGDFALPPQPSEDPLTFGPIPTQDAPEVDEIVSSFAATLDGLAGPAHTDEERDFAQVLLNLARGFTNHPAAPDIPASGHLSPEGLASEGPTTTSPPLVPDEIDDTAPTSTDESTDKSSASYSDSNGDDDEEDAQGDVDSDDDDNAQPDAPFDGEDHTAPAGNNAPHSLDTLADEPLGDYDSEMADATAIYSASPNPSLVSLQSTLVDSTEALHAYDFDDFKMNMSYAGLEADAIVVDDDEDHMDVSDTHPTVASDVDMAGVPQTSRPPALKVSKLIKGALKPIPRFSLQQLVSRIKSYGAVGARFRRTKAKAYDETLSCGR